MCNCRNLFAKSWVCNKFSIAYYSNNSNDNSTITNATNSTIMENITGGDTVTISLKPSDKGTTLF